MTERIDKAKEIIDEVLERLEALVIPDASQLDLDIHECELALQQARVLLERS